MKVFVPQDTTARSLGADRVADAVRAVAEQRDLDIDIVRNGSRGLYWLEPMVEIERDGTRYAYGPVSPSDVESLFESGFTNGGDSPGDGPLALGATEEIPYLKNQTRLTFARVGLHDPLSIDDYIADGGFSGLKNALDCEPDEIIDIVKESGLRGRGGAAFPTGIKWKTVRDAPAEQKYIVVNADEGDSGTFADRMIMESDPFVLIEGMIIAGLATGATMGYIYVRAEYPQSIATLNTAIELAHKHGYLGNSVNCFGKSFSDSLGHAFDIEVREAAGAYICGEETSLLESLEGKRGMVRYRPPLPAIKGFLGQPTVVNNVITIATVPIILDKGAAYYKDFGAGNSRGTNTFQLSGNIKQGGLVETAFGLSLRELIEDYGGGSYSGRPIKAVQVGGPLGAYLNVDQLDTPMQYGAFQKIDAMLGHGGIVVFDDTVDMGEQARFAMEFCAIESCGKCTPCRVGSVRGVEVIDRMRAGTDTEMNTELLRDLCETMIDGSLCAMGGLTPFPVLSVLKYFPEELGVKE